MSLHLLYVLMGFFLNQALELHSFIYGIELILLEAHLQMLEMLRLLPFFLFFWVKHHLLMGHLGVQKSIGVSLTSVKTIRC